MTVTCRHAHDEGVTKNPRKLYLETSFWKRLTGPVTDWRRPLTFRFLRTAHRHHELFISPLVVQEADQSPTLEERRLIRRKLSTIHPRILPRRRELPSTIRELLECGGWGDRKTEDITHIAFAILYGVDALLTWDVDDLARPQTRRVVQAWCKAKSLKVPLIGTPPEVAGWLGFEIG